MLSSHFQQSADKVGLVQDGIPCRTVDVVVVRLRRRLYENQIIARACGYQFPSYAYFPVTIHRSDDSDDDGDGGRDNADGGRDNDDVSTMV